MAALKKIECLSPTYVKKFRCIGGACIDSCCYGWTVTIDKKTYKKYKAVTDPDFALFLKKYIKELPNDKKKPNNFAKIDFDPTQDCPFMNEKGLCDIQLKMGTEALSITCNTYPRTRYMIDGVMQKALSMSCIEAAKLALLNPDGMDFSIDTDEYNINYDIAGVYYKIDTDNVKKEYAYVRYVKELRAFCVDTLQNRECDFEDRLIIIGLLCQKLDGCIAEDRVGDIPGVIASYASNMKIGAFTEGFSGLPKIDKARYGMFHTFLMHARSGSRLFKSMYEKILTGFKYDPEVPDQFLELEALLTDGITRIYQPFMRDYGYIIENYFVNYVFMQKFPFVRVDESMVNNFMILAIDYLSFKFFLIGYALGNNDKLTPDDAVQFISALARKLEHSPDFINTVLERLKADRLNSVPLMASLIKEV